MKLDAVRAMHRREPFRRFLLWTESGRSFRVDHPEMLSVGQSDEIVIVHNADGGFNIIETDAITELTAAKLSKRNGNK